MNLRSGKPTAIIAALALGLVIRPGAAQAQSTRASAWPEDPDVLEPDAGATYVGRIGLRLDLRQAVPTIDEKLNVVPQLALSHQVSADGKASRSSCARR